VTIKAAASRALHVTFCLKQSAIVLAPIDHFSVAFLRVVYLKLLSIFFFLFLLLLVPLPFDSHPCLRRSCMLATFFPCLV
jgi:hypothetical protein